MVSVITLIETIVLLSDFQAGIQVKNAQAPNQNLASQIKTRPFERILHSPPGASAGWAPLALGPCGWAARRSRAAK